MYDKRASVQKISKKYIESRFFGLMKDTIGNQQLSRVVKRLEWMFKKGQHTVRSYVDRSNTYKHIEVNALGSSAKIEGVLVNPKGGFSYANLVVDIDGSKTKISDFDQAVELIYQHFSDLGLKG